MHYQQTKTVTGFYHVFVMANKQSFEAFFCGITWVRPAKIELLLMLFFHRCVWRCSHKRDYCCSKFNKSQEYIYRAHRLNHLDLTVNHLFQHVGRQVQKIHIEHQRGHLTQGWTTLEIIFAFTNMPKSKLLGCLFLYSL